MKGEASEEVAAPETPAPPPQVSDEDRAASRRHLAEGRAHFGARRFEAAQDAFAAAAGADPTHSEALVWLGRSCVVRSPRMSPSRGLEAFRSALALDETSQVAWWGVGIAAFLTSDYEACKEGLDRLFATGGGDLLPEQLGEAHHFYGTVLVFAGAYDEALPHLEESSALYPTFPESHYQKGIVLEKKGEPAKAEACFLEAVRLAPDHLPSHFRLSRIFGRAGDEERAARHRRIHELINELTDNTSERLSQDPDRRQRILGELSQVQPENHGARLEFCQLLMRSSPDAAMLAVDTLVNEGTKLPRAWFLRAELALRVGDQAGAKDVMTRFAEAIPGFPPGQVPATLRPLLPR